MEEGEVMDESDGAKILARCMAVRTLSLSLSEISGAR